MKVKKKSTKERFAELVRNLTDTEFEMLVYGINQITFEWGWEGEDENFKHSPLIRECWERSEDE